MKILQIIRRVHPETAFVKCMAVLLAYFFGSYVTGRFHQESGFIGAILACTSAIVVLQSVFTADWADYANGLCGIGDFYRGAYCLDLSLTLFLLCRWVDYCGIYSGIDLYAFECTR